MSDSEYFTVVPDTENDNYKVVHLDNVRAIFADKDDAEGFAEHKNYKLVKNKQYAAPGQTLILDSVWCGLGDTNDINSLFIDWGRVAETSKGDNSETIVGHLLDNNRQFVLHFEPESGKFWYDNHPSREI